jgi:hypothetical protein
MTKDPSSCSKTGGGGDPWAIVKMARKTESHTQDVEFQPFRIPYIKELLLPKVDRRMRWMGVKNKDPLAV